MNQQNDNQSQRMRRCRLSRSGKLAKAVSVVTALMMVSSLVGATFLIPPDQAEARPPGWGDTTGPGGSPDDSDDDDDDDDDGPDNGGHGSPDDDDTSPPDDDDDDDDGNGSFGGNPHETTQGNDQAGRDSDGNGHADTDNDGDGQVDGDTDNDGIADDDDDDDDDDPQDQQTRDDAENMNPGDRQWRSTEKDREIQDEAIQEKVEEQEKEQEREDAQDQQTRDPDEGLTPGDEQWRSTEKDRETNDKRIEEECSPNCYDPDDPNNESNQPDEKTGNGSLDDVPDTEVCDEDCEEEREDEYWEEKANNTIKLHHAFVGPTITTVNKASQTSKVVQKVMKPVTKAFPFVPVVIIDPDKPAEENTKQSVGVTVAAIWPPQTYSYIVQAACDLGAPCDEDTLNENKKATKENVQVVRHATDPAVDAGIVGLTIQGEVEMAKSQGAMDLAETMIDNVEDTVDTVTVWVTDKFEEKADEIAQLKEDLKGLFGGCSFLGFSGKCVVKLGVCTGPADVQASLGGGAALDALIPKCETSVSSSSHTETQSHDVVTRRWGYEYRWAGQWNDQAENDDTPYTTVDLTSRAPSRYSLSNVAPTGGVDLAWLAGVAPNSASDRFPGQEHTVITVCRDGDREKTWFENGQSVWDANEDLWEFIDARLTAQRTGCKVDGEDPLGGFDVSTDQGRREYYLLDTMRNMKAYAADPKNTNRWDGASEWAYEQVKTAAAGTRFAGIDNAQINWLVDSAEWKHLTAVEVSFRPGEAVTETWVRSRTVTTTTSTTTCDGEETGSSSSTSYGPWSAWAAD